MNQQIVVTLATSRGKVSFYPEEIIRLEASSNYTRIYFRDRPKLVSARVLKDFAALLEPMGFVRIHRTHLVNRRHVRCVSPNGMVIMNDASVAGISRRLKSGVLKLLNAA